MEYQSITVQEDTKERFSSLRRRLEAARDRDMTENEIVAELIDSFESDESPDGSGDA